MRKHSPEKQKGASRGGKPGQQNGVISWFAALKSSWRVVFQFDRSQVTAFQAIRSMFGVALPLAIGVATGQVITGTVIAAGGFMLGSVGLRDTTLTRTQAMLLSSLLVTLSALVGGLAGGSGSAWLLVIVVGVWGFGAGIFASLSSVAQVIGIQACAALIVYSHFAAGPLQAAITAGLVGSGALFQTLLALLPSPWTNTAPERSALAAIYQKLADYATNPSRYDTLLASDALLAGHTTLLHSNTRTEQGLMFARLLEQAERLRLALAILINRRQHLSEKEAEEPSAEWIGASLDQIMRLSGAALRVIARELAPSLSFANAGEQEPIEEMKKVLAGLRRAELASEKKIEIERILPYCTALLGELHIARRLVTAWKSARQSWPARIRFPYPRPPALHHDTPWHNLRANLTPHSSAFRHAARLAVTLMVAMAIYQFFHLQSERGYWIPLTAALVLRSDFITTFTRGTARLLGTMLGAVLTTLLIVFLAPSPPLLVIFVAATSYLMFATLFANYTIFSVVLTIATVFLISFVAPQTTTIAADRAIDTVLGGILALLIYALWPTWEQSQVPENIAKRLEALGHYLKAAMQAYVDPKASPIRPDDRLHIASRLARSNALGSVHRSLQEPETHRVNAELATALLEAADGISRSVLALEAYLLDNPQHDTLPVVALFSTAADEALSQLASALREKQPAPALPGVEQALKNLKAAIKAKKSLNGEGRGQWRFVSEEARRIATNIQVMQQLLSTAAGLT